MTTGALIFAFNNEATDYLAMAQIPDSRALIKWYMQQPSPAEHGGLKITPAQ